MSETFREFYERKHGAWDHLRFEYTQTAMQRIAETMADWADKLAADVRKPAPVVCDEGTRVLSAELAAKLGALRTGEARQPPASMYHWLGIEAEEKISREGWFDHRKGEVRSYDEFARLRHDLAVGQAAYMANMRNYAP